MGARAGLAGVHRHRPALSPQSHPAPPALGRPAARNLPLPADFRFPHLSLCQSFGGLLPEFLGHLGWDGETPVLMVGDSIERDIVPGPAGRVAGLLAARRGAERARSRRPAAGNAGRFTEIPGNGGALPSQSGDDLPPACWPRFRLRRPSSTISLAARRPNGGHCARQQANGRSLKFSVTCAMWIWK